MSLGRGFSFFSVLVLALTVPSCGGPGPVSPDAEIDAAGPDGGPPCSGDADCDDGLFCNGPERCALSSCAPGAAVRCDDGIDCTIDACSEDMRACVARVPDADRDGAGDQTCVDAGGAPLGNDCADDDANRFPGNTEVCDARAHDEDCDETSHGALDADGDGFEDERCCNGAACGDDCNDARSDAHPGATEVCDLIDDDCDGNVDEGVSVAGFVDADRDGYGDGARPTSACGTASGFSPYGSDCADDLVSRNPGQAEFCDGLDNDCDTRVDEGAANVPWYPDLDADGFGAGAVVSACVPPAGHSLLGSDCDDAAAAISPAAAEVCDGIDNDCTGAADFAISSGDLEDDDGDGVADARCGAPRGLDCDDRDAASGPSEAETCDGRDNDCDARIDEAATTVAFFRDADGDGYGTDAALIVACTQPSGYSRRGGDCDDASMAIRPGSSEACNSIDEDCDGAVDEAEASLTCSAPNAASVCVSGSCEIAVCYGGFGDCSAAPGCESDLLSDVTHCGSCAGCDDPGSLCAMGTCRPTLESLGRLGSASSDHELVNDVAPVPGTDDFIVVGAFRGTLSFGATVLTSLGGLDGFAARIRPDGTAPWAARWGGALDDEMTAIAIEPTTGGLVLGGNLCGPQTVCGGPIGSGTTCIGFWQRFANVSLPGCPYATVLDGTGGTELGGLAMERSGGQTFVYVGGAVRGSSSALAVGSTSDLDGFVSRFRETTGTTWEWTRLAEAPFVDRISDIALDGAGRVIALGTASGPIDYGLGPGAFAGFSDAFIFSMTASTGVPITGRMFGTSGGYDTGSNVAVSGATVYATGLFGIPDGPSVLNGVPSNGQEDGYLVAFDGASLGTTWTRALGGTDNDFRGATELAIVDGAAVVTGNFRGAMTLGTSTFTSDAGTDGFIAAFGADGALRWARAAHGFGDEASVGAAGLSSGRVVWLTGFGPGLSISGMSLASGVGLDVGVAALGF